MTIQPLVCCYTCEAWFPLVPKKVTSEVPVSAVTHMHTSTCTHNMCHRHLKPGSQYDARMTQHKDVL